jgi:hypothetical protein
MSANKLRKFMSRAFVRNEQPSSAHHVEARGNGYGSFTVDVTRYLTAHSA